jgi:hypothetical protein
LHRDCRRIGKNSGSYRKAAAGTMHPAMHGQTERSGCTPAEPYPLSRKTTLHPKSKFSRASR